MLLAPTPHLSGQVTRIDGGLPGVLQTLAQMRRMVNASKVTPQIRQIATQAIFLTPEKDDLSEIAALFTLVRDNVRYVRDVNNVETLCIPEKTLEGRMGDCDDQTMALASLLESVGYPTRFVVAGYNGGDFEHVYLQVWSGAEWISLDPTEHHPMGWEPPGATVKAYEAV